LKCRKRGEREQDNVAYVSLGKFAKVLPGQAKSKEKNQTLRRKMRLRFQSRIQNISQNFKIKKFLGRVDSKIICEKTKKMNEKNYSF